MPAIVAAALTQLQIDAIDRRLADLNLEARRMRPAMIIAGAVWLAIVATAAGLPIFAAPITAAALLALTVFVRWTP